MTEARTKRQKMQRVRGACKLRPNYVPLSTASQGKLTPWQFIDRSFRSLEQAVEYFAQKGAPGIRVLYHPGKLIVIQGSQTLAVVESATWQMALAAALNASPHLFPTEQR